MNTGFPDLVTLFDNIPAPTLNVGLGRFCVQPIQGFPGCFIGKDTSGNPVLLIQANNTLPGTAAPLVLESLSVIHLVNCRLQAAGAADQQRTLSIIRCTDTSRDLHEYFLRCLHPIVMSLPAQPSRDHITEAVERLVELFRRMTNAPKKAVAGLWAELLLIARATNPSLTLTAWHAMPEERFDFAQGFHRIDVKAACGSMRVHHFSLEQLRPPAGTTVLIASLILSQSEGGTSVNDLVDGIRSMVTDPNMLIQLDRVIAETIGQDWRSTQKSRFDLPLAIQSLRFIDATTIPAVATPVPVEISDVHFRVDLSQHNLTYPTALVGASPLYRAAIPSPAATMPGVPAH